MDILKDFKHFLLGGELSSLVYDFRHPKQPNTFVEIEVIYQPETDSHFIISEADSDYDTFGNGTTIPFTYFLEKEFNRIKIELQAKCDKLLQFGSSNPNLINKVFEASDVDFCLIRQQVEEDVNLNRYWESLLFFILEIESIYIGFKKEALSSGRQKTIEAKRNRSNVRSAISFEFKGDLRILKKIYHELNLEAGEFVNKQKTTEGDFVNILTAENVLCATGMIRFACESRQVAYIFKKMSGEFSNLKYALIEGSKKFESKKGTLLKADSLSKYLADIKEVKEKDSIDDFFATLHQNQ